MKTITSTFVWAMILGIASLASAQTITVNPAQPEEPLLDAIVGGAVATLINSDAAQGARGSAFTLGATGEEFDISSLTIQSSLGAANGVQFVEDQTFLTVAVFEGALVTNASPFVAPPAGVTLPITPQDLVDVSLADPNIPDLTLLGSESFDLFLINADTDTPGLLSNGFVTFNLTDSIRVDGGADLSVFAFTNGPDAFPQAEGNNNGGGRLRLTDSELLISGVRDFRFSLEGELVGAVSIACDLDGDQDCDNADIDILFDNDGDINQWLSDASTIDNPANPGALLTFAVGDVDLDGEVNSADLGMLLNNFSADTVQSSLWIGGDLDDSGGVTSSDLGLLLNNFGFSSAAAASAVPEPSSSVLLLALAGMMCCVLRSARK